MPIRLASVLLCVIALAFPQTFEEHRIGKLHGERFAGYALGPLADDPDATVRDLRRGAPVPDRLRETFEQVPVLAVLYTAADDPWSWVRAGQALQRVLLTATLHGISASFVNQPLETPALRRTVLGGGNVQGHPQMLLRLGRGIPVPPTPRRPIDEVTDLAR